MLGDCVVCSFVLILQNSISKVNNELKQNKTSKILDLICDINANKWHQKRTNSKLIPDI